MATKAHKPKNDRIRVSCSLAPDMARLIDVLIETGAFGRSRAEVLERLAQDRLTRMWQDGEFSPERLKMLLITPSQIRQMKEGD